MPDDCEGIPSCCDDNWFQYHACCPVPVVSTGENQEVEVGSGIVFSGTASDYQTVEWTQISGPEITIQNPSTLTASVDQFENDGTYVFRLTGFNQCGSAYSDVSVTVVSTCPDPERESIFVQMWLVVDGGQTEGEIFGESCFFEGEITGNNFVSVEFNHPDFPGAWSQQVINPPGSARGAKQGVDQSTPVGAYDVDSSLLYFNITS